MLGPVLLIYQRRASHMTDCYNFHGASGCAVLHYVLDVFSALYPTENIASL